MATVSSVVYNHHKKADGTFNVKIRVYHKKEKKYIDTQHFVTRKQLGPKGKIKDPIISQLLDETLLAYRKEISDLKWKLEYLTCEQLRDHLKDRDEDINFIAFCTEHIELLFEGNRRGTAKNHTRVRNGLIDFFKRENASITEIHYNMLVQLERFLKTERKLVRVNQLNKEVITVKKGVKEAGLHTFMRDLRTLFNEACRKYNKEDLGIYRINHYPFKKYKVGSPPLTRKRNMPIEDLRSLRDCQVEPNTRAELARDLGMLSLYLCGMNAADLYNLPPFKKGTTRIEYNRAKTCSVRKDNAFISIKVVPEAIPLLEKYAGTLQYRYSTPGGLDTALSLGMQQLRLITEIPDISFYWLRHSFATIARNVCRMTTDDIGLALNHVDEGHRTTDIYIEKDWSIVDEVQFTFMCCFNGIDPHSFDDAEIWKANLKKNNDLPIRCTIPMYIVR